MSICFLPETQKQPSLLTPSRFLIVPENHSGLSMVEDAKVFFLYGSKKAALAAIERLRIPGAMVKKAATVQDLTHLSDGMLLAGTNTSALYEVSVLENNTISLVTGNIKMSDCDTVKEAKFKHTAKTVKKNFGLSVGFSIIQHYHVVCRDIQS